MVKENAKSIINNWQLEKERRGAVRYNGISRHQNRSDTSIRSDNRSRLSTQRRQSFNNCPRKDGDVSTGFRRKLFQLRETTMTRARLSFRIPLGSRMSFMQIAFRDTPRWGGVQQPLIQVPGQDRILKWHEFETDYDFCSPRMKDSCSKECFSGRN